MIFPRRNKGLTWCRENVAPRCTCIKETLTNWWSYVWLTHKWLENFSSLHWLLFAFFIRLYLCTKSPWMYVYILCVQVSGSPGPEWSGTPSSLLCPAAADARWTGWRCWPKLPACMGADTAACCDASPSGRCSGRSPGWSPPLASDQEDSRPPWQSRCSRHQT